MGKQVSLKAERKSVNGHATKTRLSFLPGVVLCGLAAKPADHVFSLALYLRGNEPRDFAPRTGPSIGAWAKKYGIGIAPAAIDV